AFCFQPLAPKTECTSRIRAGRNRKLYHAIERRNTYFSSENSLVKRDRQLQAQVGAIGLEQRMRRDVDRDQPIARLAARARPALPLQPDLLATCDSRRNLDLDVLAGRQVHARLGPFGRIGERDRQRSMQVLSAGRRRKILGFKRRARIPRGTPPAEHSPQHSLEAGTAAAGAAETVRTKAETFEMRPAARVETASALLRTEAFETLETRLAFRIDLAAVECLALVGIANDFVWGIELGEARGGFGIVLVGIRVQFFRE